MCDSQTIIELKVFGLCEADTLHSVMRAPEELEEEGKGGGGCLMISCFSSGALPEQNWSDYQQHLVVICIITHPCENLPGLR